MPRLRWRAMYSDKHVPRVPVFAEDTFPNPFGFAAIVYLFHFMWSKASSFSAVSCVLRDIVRGSGYNGTGPCQLQYQVLLISTRCTCEYWMSAWADYVCGTLSNQLSSRAGNRALSCQINRAFNPKQSRGGVESRVWKLGSLGIDCAWIGVIWRIKFH